MLLKQQSTICINPATPPPRMWIVLVQALFLVTMLDFWSGGLIKISGGNGSLYIPLLMAFFSYVGRNTSFRAGVVDRGFVSSQ